MPSFLVSTPWLNKEEVPNPTQTHDFSIILVYSFSCSISDKFCSAKLLSFVEEMADEIVFLLDGKIYFKGTLAAIKEQTKQTDLEHAIAAILTKENV